MTPLILAALASTAQWGNGGSQAIMQPHPACYAEITIHNRRIDDPGEYDVTITGGGVTVGIHITVPKASGAGDLGDSFVFTPPDGFLALPDRLTIAEDATDTVLICSVDGVGV